jgi:DNA repair exonuclease SbcCD ATPase subunit
LIATALAVLLVLIQQPYFGIGMIFLAAVLGYFYLRELIKRQTNAAQQGEIERIAEEYKNRFGDSSVVQEATLKAKYKELQTAKTKVDVLTNEIQGLTNEIGNIEQQIEQDFKKLTYTQIKKKDWQSSIKAINEKRTEIDQQIRKIENTLSSLNVDENDYLTEPTDIEYDPHLQKVITDELSDTEVEMKRADSELQMLKSKVCGITGEPITNSWENLVEALNAKRQREVAQYKEITAGILARIKVNEVLNDLREIEEKRIEEGLSSDIISQALLATTGHYDRVEKEGGELYVTDAFNRYRLSDLSTGAREQVLLGLRIGFASRILGG